MSAYMVSDAHIHAILITAIEGPKDAQEQIMRGQWSQLTFGNPSKKLWYETAAECGRMLVYANAISVDHRYPKHPSSRWAVSAYRFKESAPRLTVVQALKALDCFDYQSSEHPDWESSPARKFSDCLRARLITMLPGYDAAQWEVA